MKMNYFPFTFLFNVPGLSNPFASSAPAAADDSEAKTDLEQLDTKRLKRNFDGSAAESQSSNGTGTARPAPPYRKRPPPPACPPTRLVRKRGWQPSSAAPSQAAVIKPSTSGIFDIAPESLYQNMSSASGKGQESEDVELDLPPAKRHKGLAESIISTTFNAALVGAAVGLTVFRLWRERGKEVEQSPPPPYQEEWANPTPVTSPQPEPQPASRSHKTNASSSSHRRHAGSMRHRQKVVRKTVHIRRDNDLTPKKPSPQLPQDEFVGHSSFNRRPGSEDDTLEEMDWIGDRLAQLIEEGNRALGKEIVVASEAPEDEEDDGSGNWVEDEPEASAPLSVSSPRRVPLMTPSKRFRHEGAYSVPNAGSSRLSSFPSHSRFHSDDLTTSLQSTPQNITTPAVGSGPVSTPLLSRAYESESPSIRESMERARAAYLQKRGLGINTPGGSRY